MLWKIEKQNSTRKVIQKIPKKLFELEKQFAKNIDLNKNVKSRKKQMNSDMIHGLITTSTKILTPKRMEKYFVNYFYYWYSILDG